MPRSSRAAGPWSSRCTARAETRTAGEIAGIAQESRAGRVHRRRHRRPFSRRAHQGGHGCRGIQRGDRARVQDRRGTSVLLRHGVGRDAAHRLPRHAQGCRRGAHRSHGISKGGIETYFTAAADPRVAAAVSYIGVQRFKWALDNGQWRARIATIQDGFERGRCAAWKVAAQRGFRPRVLCARGAGHRWEVRWAGDVDAHRAAAAARDQRGFGCEHADCGCAARVRAAQPAYERRMQASN